MLATFYFNFFSFVNLTNISKFAFILLFRGLLTLVTRLVLRGFLHMVLTHLKLAQLLGKWCPRSWLLLHHPRDSCQWVVQGFKDLGWIQCNLLVLLCLLQCNHQLLLLLPHLQCRLLILQMCLVNFPSRFIWSFGDYRSNLSKSCRSLWFACFIYYYLIKRLILVIIILNRVKMDGLKYDLLIVLLALLTMGSFFCFFF